MPFETVLEMHRSQAAAFGDRMAAAAAALDTLPRVLVEPLIDAYLSGAVFVAGVLERGGWPALDSLYVDPPTTTEQVLHADRFFPERDEPRAPFMQSPASLMSGWDLLLDDSLGELYVRTLFATGRLRARAPELAGGWDGDRLVVVGRGSRGEEDWFVVWATLWDSEEDAAEFAAGYNELMVELHGAGEAESPADHPHGGGDRSHLTAAGRVTCVGRRGDQVTITQAADATLARRLLERSLPVE
jgi:hypothetical protein